MTTTTDLPTRDESYEIAETRTHPASIKMSGEKLALIIRTVYPELIKQGEVVDHVVRLHDGTLCLFLEDANGE